MASVGSTISGSGRSATWMDRGSVKTAARIALTKAGERRVFRSSMSGFGKAVWLVFVIILPFLGVFIYLIAHGGAITQTDFDALKAKAVAQ